MWVPSPTGALALPLPQRDDGVPDNPRRLLDRLLRQRPVARLHDVADGGKESLVVAGPQLRAEDDMAELGAVGDLNSHQLVVRFLALR